jgi:hypothetical protein
MSEDPTKALVLMILTRPLDAAPFPPPRTDPWQSQPLAVYPFSSIGSEALKVDLFVIWAVMKGYDQNAELSPIMPGTYRLVNGEEPMVGFNFVAAKETNNGGVEVQKLYWVEKSVNNPSRLMSYQSRG